MHYVQLINRMNDHYFPDTSIRATFNIFTVVLVLNFHFTYSRISAYLYTRDNAVLVILVNSLSELRNSTTSPILESRSELNHFGYDISVGT